MISRESMINNWGDVGAQKDITDTENTQGSYPFLKQEKISSEPEYDCHERAPQQHDNIVKNLGVGSCLKQNKNGF